MRRADLAGLPPVRLPPGFALRPFGRGDADRVFQLLIAGFAESSWTPRALRRHFMRSELWRPERMTLVCRADWPVAVAVAWQGRTQPASRGMLQWVTTDAAYRRRGLGRAAVLGALAWMRGQGLRDVYLVTEVWRPAAVHLYLGLGFRPWMEASTAMPAQWVDALGHLARGGYPAPPSPDQNEYTTNPT
jgi:GNAT superfamily N-acetyltransferase